MQFRSFSPTLILLVGSIASVSVAPASAQEAPPIRVELNRLEDAGADCRATVVTENEGAALDSLKLDLVVFDGDGIVSGRLIAELGPLAAAKTVVKTFPVAGMACPAIGRVLVNDVTACNGDGGPQTHCIDRIATATRTAVRFGK